MDDCDCWPLTGVLAPMNDSYGIQACNECNALMSDLDAALRLAQWIGGEVRFWQHDAERLADYLESGDESDLAEAGFELRTYTSPGRVDDLILTGTDPWIELDGERVNWSHVRRLRAAPFKD